MYRLQWPERCPNTCAKCLDIQASHTEHAPLQTLLVKTPIIASRYETIDARHQFGKIYVKQDGPGGFRLVGIALQPANVAAGVDHRRRPFALTQRNQNP
jgi:hypothetical protein